MGLIACSLIPKATLPLKIAAGGFLFGQALFIIPLFIKAVKGREAPVGKVMPFGGIGIMLGWLCLMFA